MQELSRKIFIKGLLGTTATVAIGSAIPIFASKEPMIRDDLEYAFAVDGREDRLASGKDTRDGLIQVLKVFHEDDALEYLLERMERRNCYFNVYKPIAGDVCSKRVDRFPITKEWLCEFCARYGIV